jgi:hypothetical protein
LFKQYYDEYWDFAMRTPFGATLLEQFYSDLESRRSYLERCARSKIAAIPADARPLNLDWARLLPRPLLRRVAEFYCAFGTGRWNAVGLRLWHIYESRS